MSTRVICDEHGEDVCSYACVHIIEALEDMVPRGFWWSVGEDGEYSALCQQCNDLSDDEWARREGDLWQVLCFGCFKKAAALNEISLQVGGETMQ